MPAVAVTARSGAPAETDADTRVVPVFEDESLDDADLQALVDSGEAKASPKKTAVFHRNGERVILAGAGKRDEADAERMRVAAAAAASRAKEIGAKALAWDEPETMHKLRSRAWPARFGDVEGQARQLEQRIADGRGQGGPGG